MTKETKEMYSSLNSRPYQPYRSYKKKYRKLLAKFEEVMAESNSLHQELIHAKVVYQQLKYEIDMYSETLVQLNKSTHLPLATKLQVSAQVNPLPADLTPEMLFYNSLVKECEELDGDRNLLLNKRNPMSLSCWLIRNQPELILDGKEGGRRRRGGKRVRGEDMEEDDDLVDEKRVKVQ